MNAHEIGQLLALQTRIAEALESLIKELQDLRYTSTMIEREISRVADAVGLLESP